MGTRNELEVGRSPLYSALLEIADRCEKGTDEWGDLCLDDLCRRVHEIDPHSNVNGSCAPYLTDLYSAKRLIPKNHIFSICHDRNEVRAVVAVWLTEREAGFSVVPHGPYAETRALCAAALRARASSNAVEQEA